MATFTGTDAHETITPLFFSPTVTSDPPNSKPSNAVDIINGNGGYDYMQSGGGNDFLYGGPGNDYLDGQTGNDYLAGGPDNDTYVVDSPSDVVFESANAGVDKVNAYINHTLALNVEYLYLGDGATNGTGNTLNNVIVGNNNVNSLSGLAGNDSLYGYFGNDILNGGPGTDTMVGGTGNDTYYVDSSSDVASEAANAGADKVYAYVNEILNANVENLYLYGAAANGTGNSLNNVIVGNSLNNTLKGLTNNDALYGYAGHDILNGGPGTDTMVGGTGNDTYYIDSPGDVASEAANAGADKVYAYVNEILNANVENLYLYGAAANGTGNTLNNVIAGNSNPNSLSGLAGKDSLYRYAGNDTLKGGPGIDYLNGSTGQDHFVFAESGATNRDTISDFSHVYDTIVLQDKLDGVTNGAIKGLAFPGGVLSNYFEGAGFTGNGAQVSGIYNNTTTGNIYYNPTSGTVGDAVLICTVGVPTAASLDHTDFVYSA